VEKAMVACPHLGLLAKYIGTISDDERGRILHRLLAKQRRREYADLE
jgi:hypothetical protein